MPLSGIRRYRCAEVDEYWKALYADSGSDRAKVKQLRASVDYAEHELTTRALATAAEESESPPATPGKRSVPPEERGHGRRGRGRGRGAGRASTITTPVRETEPQDGDERGRGRQSGQGRTSRGRGKPQAAGPGARRGRSRGDSVGAAAVSEPVDLPSSSSDEDGVSLDEGGFDSMAAPPVLTQQHGPSDDRDGPAVDDRSEIQPNAASTETPVLHGPETTTPDEPVVSASSPDASETASQQSGRRAGGPCPQRLAWPACGPWGVHVTVRSSALRCSCARPTPAT